MVSLLDGPTEGILHFHTQDPPQEEARFIYHLSALKTVREANDFNRREKLNGQPKSGTPEVVVQKYL